MTRRNPAKPRKIHTINSNSHPVSRHRGFTTIELMLVVVLTAIVSALAIPSYTSMVERRLLIKNTEQIAAFLNSVDSIANMTNQVITLTLWIQFVACSGTLMIHFNCMCMPIAVISI